MSEIVFEASLQAERARLGADAIVRSMLARLNEERGQTAAEYVGIILVVAAVIGLIATQGIGTAITKQITDTIKNMKSG
jgi:Flp pilus assembly pilin Flp